MKDLRTFLDCVRLLGPTRYLEVDRPLKRDLEIGAVQHRLLKDGCSPVVYCPRVEGSRLPLVTGVLGTYDMLGLALDIPAAQLGPGKREAVLREYLRRVQNLAAPVEVPANCAPVREVVLAGNDIDLGLLPITRHAPLNPAPYVTAGMTVCRNPDSGVPNVGIYRHEVKGKNRLACLMMAGHHGTMIGQRYADLHQPMEVALIIGHHPACAIAAAATRPSRMDENELRLMGALLGEPIEVTKGLTVDLPIPARAEIAIEGIIDPLAMEREGPFSEGAGYYGEGNPCYVIRVTAITMRHDAIYQDLHPTHPEHNLTGQVQREANMYEAVRAVNPGVRGVHLGPDGVSVRSLTYVSIKKMSIQDPVAAGTAALAADFGKVAVVVDDDIDVCEEQEVLWAVATRLGASHVLPIKRGGMTSAINPASFATGGNLSSPEMKLILDATKPLGRPFPEKVTFPKEMME